MKTGYNIREGSEILAARRAENEREAAKTICPEAIVLPSPAGGLSDEPDGSSGQFCLVAA